MHVTIGTPVHTRDDQAVGTVEQVILDPATSTVKAAVIRRGGLLHRDVEVPVTALEPGPAGDLRLAYTADQLDQVPDFQESRYTATPPIGTALPAGYGTGGLLWPVGAGIMPPVAPVPGSAWEADAEDEAVTTPTQQDLANALVAEGSDVISRDGRVVGQLGGLSFDPAAGRLTHVTVRRGLIFTQDTELPASLIARSDDRVLTLRLDAATLEAWLQVAEGMAVWTRDGVVLGTVRRRLREALEVVERDGERRLRVPLTAVAWVEDGVVRLAVAAAQTDGWPAPPPEEPPAQQTVPLL